MLRIADQDIVTRPVLFELPDGQTAKIPFTFRLVGRKALKRLVTGKLGDEEAEQVLVDNTLGWEGLADPEGKPIPFSLEAFLALLDRRWFERAVAREFLAACLGAPAKN
ncbi:hypothetical protein [Thioalbus denitrificans]|uniref:Uncharacterized protein n=1 Tax=Thioalbus denitrificans TaxID=547122 RepID=A0A369CDJ9_9GAMM|nr:hypothetical protein [Thioalbus denitrificans]RCX32080.1 hypothetical protein DFQ59_102433 [Thioalbus denitrificans]